MILDQIMATFTFSSGITLKARINDYWWTLDALEEIAYEAGRRPEGESLDVAWPGQGHQHPEGKVLCDVGILKTSGSIGGGYPAVTGPRFKEFYDEVTNEDRFQKYHDNMIMRLHALKSYEMDGFTRTFFIKGEENEQTTGA